MTNRIPEQKSLLQAARQWLFAHFLRLSVIPAAIIILLYLSGLRPYIVLSGSMEPAVHTGSLIFIDTNKKDAGPGDIITVDISAGKNKKLLVTHRVVCEENGFIVTRGDSNDTADSFRVSRESIVGTYAFQIPCIGYLIVFIRQQLRAAGHFIIRMLHIKDQSG